MKRGKQYRRWILFQKDSFACLTFFIHRIQEISSFLYCELHSTNEFLLVCFCITEPAASRCQRDGDNSSRTFDS
jgi:hypothetical protein